MISSPTIVVFALLFCTSFADDPCRYETSKGVIDLTSLFLSTAKFVSGYGLVILDEKRLVDETRTSNEDHFGQGHDEIMSIGHSCCLFDVFLC